MGNASRVMDLSCKEDIDEALDQLRFVVEHGIALGGIEPQIVDRFIVRMPGITGAVFCEFRTYPVVQGGVPPFVEKKRYLRLITTDGDHTP